MLFRSSLSPFTLPSPPSLSPFTSPCVMKTSMYAGFVYSRCTYLVRCAHGCFIAPAISTCTYMYPAGQQGTYIYMYIYMVYYLYLPVRYADGYFIAPVISTCTYPAGQQGTYTCTCTCTCTVDREIFVINNISSVPLMSKF